MSTEEEKIKAEAASLLNRVKPHLVWIAFGIGVLLGFIAGHVKL